MLRRRLALPVAAVFGAATLSPLSAQESAQETAQESAKNIIAAHIRTQGYACDAPQSATRDRRASRPLGAVWLVRCESATYRVRLIPDMAAIVEQVD